MVAFALFGLPIQLPDSHRCAYLRDSAKDIRLSYVALVNWLSSFQRCAWSRLRLVRYAN